MNNLRWEVERTETGWAVNGYSRERIRIHADGRVSIGESAPIESYPYLTREWAEYGLESILRMEFSVKVGRLHPAIIPSSTSDFWCTAPQSVSTLNAENSQFGYKLGSKEVLTISDEGQVIKFDLPYFVWVWVKNTPVAQLIKNFWYGWGKQ